jgi:hypothetical protein
MAAPTGKGRGATTPLVHFLGVFLLLLVMMFRRPCLNSFSLMKKVQNEISESHEKVISLRSFIEIKFH